MMKKKTTPSQTHHHHSLMEALCDSIIWQQLMIIFPAIIKLSSHQINFEAYSAEQQIFQETSKKKKVLLNKLWQR